MFNNPLLKNSKSTRPAKTRGTIRSKRRGTPKATKRSVRRILPRTRLTWKQRLNPRNWFRKVTWKSFLIGLAIFFAVLAVGATGVFAYYVRDLPNPKQLSSRNVVESTKILDRNGKTLYNFHGEENRTIVKGDQVSDYVKKATIATEDARFYKHYGFDLQGILRAVRNRVTGQGLTGGGSTITQQYIKNALLTSEQTPDRKLKELILAIEIEQIYSKDEILTGYLNEIPYGSNSYGIEAAAQTYFNKSAKDLTLSESATLVAIPQAPTYYSPYGSHQDRLFIRKDYILDRMVETGSITKEEAEAAKLAAPTLDNQNFAQPNLVAPHFVFYIREQLIDRMADTLGTDRQIAEQNLDKAGYTVTTSLDMDTQTMAQKIVSEIGPDMVKKYKATNAALTAVDPKTGEVLAMVGSIDYNNSKSGNTNFAASLLQPGSSFKPFIYATAFSEPNKYSPASITYDLPTDFGKYKPNNYDGKFRGPITNREALAQSLNIPAVKNFYLAGVDNSIQTAQRLGISTLTRDPSEYGLSLVLGSGEVKPVEMAAAYAAFANEGMSNGVKSILKIEKDGQIVKDYTKDAATKAIEPEVAYQIASILSDNKARTPVFGSRNALTLPDRPVAAKTGSTENNRDAWTVGFTPQISVAVWVGNNDANKTMTRGADGSYVAAPIWNKFMTEYLKGKPVEQFKRPDTIKEVTVDKLSGKLPGDNSPADQRITDIFAPWQIPTKTDDVHVKVKIDKVSGKLATNLTPADQIEERYFFNVHSEVPSLPGWENAVKAWALANGGGTNAPTETDDVHTPDNKPTISIISPTTGSRLSGDFNIEVNVGGNSPITQVEFFINGVSIGKKTESPWSISYNAKDLPSGSQIIQATTTNSLGLTDTTQVTVSQDKDSTAPANVEKVSIANGSVLMNTPFNLSWLNPSDPDLAKVKIYRSNTLGTIGQMIAEVSATPGSTGTASIPVTNLSAGNYYFTLRPVDNNGNENQSMNQKSSQLL